MIGTYHSDVDRPGYRELLRLPQTWGIVVGKMLTDPGMVLHHRLVRHLSGVSRIFT